MAVWRFVKGQDLSKGTLAGALAGLAGAWTMNQFQALLSQARQKQQDENAWSSAKNQEAASGGEDGDATQKVASRIVRAAGRSLTKHEKDVAGAIVHYAFGCASGALYGSVAEVIPRVSKGFGLPLALALWLAADEIAVPALGLSGWALDYPLSSHLSALAAHIMYGVTTEITRRTLRSALSNR